MIITFSTGFGQLRMHGKSAVALLKLMGHSGTVPGAILAADLPEALRNLEAGLETTGHLPSPEAPPPAETEDESERRDREPVVPMRHRALPLIELVRTAIARGSDLMWQ